MDTQRWSQIEELFQRACECDPARRPRLLEESSRDDPELGEIVAALLASQDGAADYLQAAVHGGLDAVAFPPLAALSPEGERLAVARSTDGPLEIHSLRAEPTVSLPTEGLDALWNLRWAPDGKALYVSRHIPGGNELVRVDLHGGVARLWKSRGLRGFGRPSPDGRHLAIYDWVQDSNMWMMENF